MITLIIVLAKIFFTAVLCTALFIDTQCEQVAKTLEEKNNEMQKYIK